MKKLSDFKNLNYLVNSFFWSVISKFIDAVSKFIAVPVLLTYFGESNYALITLAISVNAYVQLLDLGMNTGAVRFFSLWISEGDYKRIDSVARTNLTFYSIVAGINIIVLIFLSFFGNSIFSITEDEFLILRKLFFILIFFSFSNWSIFVYNQLLIADEKISFTQQILAVKSILFFILVFCTRFFRFSINTYFLLYCVLNVIPILPYYVKCRKQNLISSFIPAFHFKSTYVIMKYSLAIFSMSFFQFSADQLRPIILSIFSLNGIRVLAEYKIISVFPNFIISLGGVIISILLPKSSKAFNENDYHFKQMLAYKGTFISSVIVNLLCFPVIMSSKEILALYVGNEYLYLYKWLIIWIVTLILFLHNSPVASLVLATGKTKTLVYSSIFSFFISISINIMFTKVLGVGSAVIGYLVYIIIQMLFYYAYFNVKVLKLNTYLVFISFLIPTLLGLILISFISRVTLTSSLISLIIRSLIFEIVYISLVYLLFKGYSKRLVDKYV